MVQSALGGDVAQNLVELTMPLQIDPWVQQTQEWKQQYACRYDAPFESVFAPRLLHNLSQAMTDKETFIC